MTTNDQPIPVRVQPVVSLPRYDAEYPKKWVECDDCGHVNLQPKAYLLKMSSCKTCGSIHIRLYKPKREANGQAQTIRLPPKP